ncbi:hypothetical protein ZIOFF_059478 [Zingiber officinale]|uniref:Uncharacterized protein n=1 Tax=Zingiber officinale TaxID=94328 RepID=A0A8J5KKA0_ZINOF|nr:hypothetical protein ZIOFF_059478 [Zingiber officinale]
MHLLEKLSFYFCRVSLPIQLILNSTESSKAFFRRPLRCLEKVTCQLARFSILLICVFPLTMSTD